MTQVESDSKRLSCMWCRRKHSMWREAETHMLLRTALTSSTEPCRWLHFDQVIIGCFSHCLHRWNSNKSVSPHPANNVPDLADTGVGMCVYLWMRAHTLTPSLAPSPLRGLSLSLFHSISLSSTNIVRFKVRVICSVCACVCVYPSGNSCPDGISNFREACNQLILRCSSLKPGGQERRGREKRVKEEGGPTA